MNKDDKNESMRFNLFECKKFILYILFNTNDILMCKLVTNVIHTIKDIEKKKFTHNIKYPFA